MELTTKIAFNAVELAGERHIAATGALDNAASDAERDAADNELMAAEATIDRLNAVYAALDALTEDDVALLVAAVARSES